MLGLLTAIGAIILTWAVLFTVFAGAGLLAGRALRSNGAETGDLVTDFWTGWALVLAMLQVWSLVLPVDGRARVATVALAGLGWLGAIRARRRVIAPPSVGFALTMALAAVWLADRSLAPPLNNDSGGYHLGAVRWVAEYGTVPGLGHVHFRFAFHSTYFLYAALLEVGPWTGRAHHVATGLLLLVLTASAVRGLLRIVRDRRDAPLAAAFDALMLPALIKAGLGPDVSSPSPDAGAFAIGIVLCRTVVRLWDGAGRAVPQAADVLRLALFAASALAIKLSTAGFVVGAAVAGAILGRASRERFRVVNVAAIAAAVLVPWAARGVILSGYPAYPATVLGAPVEWRLPEDQAAQAARWVRSWARAPGGTPAVVLSGFAWLDPWLRRIARHRLEVLLPLVMACSCLAISAARGAPAAPAANAGRAFLLLVPPAMGLVFWFVTAPDPRFAGAGFWMLAVAAVLLATVRRGWPLHALAAGAFGLAITVVAAHALRGDLFIRPALGGALYPTPVAELSEFRTDSGLVVHVPADGECWNAPLPCTPYPDRRLRLRHPGRLDSGFVLGP